VIPNLLTFQGSIVALDVKGELFEQTSRARARQGDDVFRFSPFDWAHGTHRYNPLAPIAALPDPDRQFTDVAILADLFLDRENNGANRTFSEAGKSIFVAAAMLALERGTPTLGAVRAIVTGDGTNRNEIYAGYAQETRHAVTRMLWRDAAATSDLTLASNLQALMTEGLKAWDHPAVLRATAANDIDFAAFRRRPQALYLSISEDHIQTLAPLLRLLFADLISALRDHEPGPDEPWPVIIMIDEFQQMGAMPYLERAIHTLASYGGRVAMIAQSLAALEEIYGPNGRKSLETGAGVRLYIAPRDETTIKEVSAAVGQTTAEAVTQSFGASKGLFGPKGTSARLEARPLLSETAARTMDPDDVIVLAGPQHPVKAERIKFYEDPLFAAMMAAQEGQPYPFPPRPSAATTPEPKLVDDRSERAAAGTRRRQRLANAPKAALHPLERVDPSRPLSADQRTRLVAATEAAEQAIALQPWRIGAGAHAH
ncbi:MAG: type IV secretory system conjugative DNA transfer family protein, partial [Pseudomonadota bacterium]